MYFLMYVDDVLIVAKRFKKISKLKTQLGEEFKMKFLGAMKKIFGMEI